MFKLNVARACSSCSVTGASLTGLFGFVANVVGVIGVVVLTIGVVKAIIYYIKRRPDLWRARVILVEHILFGLDFLIVRDIIESLTLKTTMLWADLAALVLMVVVRVTFSFFTGKEMEELMHERKGFLRRKDPNNKTKRYFYRRK